MRIREVRVVRRPSGFHVQIREGGHFQQMNTPSGKPLTFSTLTSAQECLELIRKQDEERNP